MAFSQLTLEFILNQTSPKDPKTNPWVELIHVLDVKQNMPVGQVLNRGLILCFITYIIIFLVALAIICVPYFQGVGGHQRRNWVFKRRYLDSYSQPYWILNSGLIVAVSHLIGSTLFLVFLGLRYTAFESGSAANSFYGSAWLEFRWAPSYYAFFNQAWSTWFVRASDASLKRKRNAIHPLVFNTNLLALPMIALVLALFLISTQAASIRAQKDSYDILIGSLQLLSHNWGEGQDFISSRQFRNASAQFTEYSMKSTHFGASFRTTGLFWTFMAVPTFIFYVFGISTLLRVMYTRFHAVNDELDQQETISQTDSPPRRLLANHGQTHSRQLLINFAYLGVYYILMSLTLFYHIIIGLIFYTSNDVSIANNAWMELFVVLSNSGSYPLLSALIVQLLRIISEGRKKTITFTQKDEKISEHEESLYRPKENHAGLNLMT